MCEEFVGADGALEKDPTQTESELPAEALLALRLDHLGQRVHEAPDVRRRVARVGQKAGTRMPQSSSMPTKPGCTPDRSRS